jgi:adhesin transport system outer membrane protein
MNIAKIVFFGIFIHAMQAANAQQIAVFITQSITKHPSVSAAQSAIQESQFGVSAAQKQYWPTPSVLLEQVNPSNADPSYAVGGVSQVYRLQQPVWTWGRIGAGVDKSKLQASVAEVNLLEARQTVAVDTLQAWLDFNGSNDKLGVIERSLRKYNELRELVQRRIEKGASAPSEISTTQARVGQAEVQRVAFQTSLAMAKSRLQQLSGISPSPVPLPASLSTWAPVPSLDEVLAFSTAVQKAQLQVQVAEAEVSVKRAQALPEVYARLEHQKYPNGLNASRVFVGLQSSFGAGLSNIDEAAALAKRIDTLRADEEAKRMEMAQQFEAIQLSLKQAQEGLPAIERNVKATMESLDSMERQFLTGRRSWLDVLNAVRETLQSELELVDAKVAIVRAQWRLALLVMPAEEAMRLYGKTGS